MDNVLHLIMKHPQMSLEDIASMMGLTFNEVQDIINEYQHKKIIRGYRPIIDTTMCDHPYVSALIEVKTNPKKDVGFDEIIHVVSHYPEVESVYLMAGEYDLAVFVLAESMMDIANFVSSKLATLDGVMSTSTRFVLKKYKELGIHFQEQTDNREKMSV